MAKRKRGGHPSGAKRLRVLTPDEAKGMGVLKLDEQSAHQPVVNSPGGTVRLACGECGFVVAVLEKRSQVVNVVLVCPSCGAYNDTGGDPSLN